MKSLLVILSVLFSLNSYANPLDKANMRNAIEFNQVNVVRDLLAKGVHPKDVISFHYEGERHTKTFLQIAQEKNRREVLELFRDYVSYGDIDFDVRRSNSYENPSQNTYNSAPTDCWGEFTDCGQIHEDGNIRKFLR